MIIASAFHPFDRDKVFYDLETWDALLESTVKTNPKAADSIARLLYKIIKNLGEGKRGVEKTVNTLKLGIEWIYPYTDAHKMSFEAFLYELEGLMLIGDYPAELMKGAIERAVKSEEAFEAELAKQQPSKKKGSRGKTQTSDRRD